MIRVKASQEMLHSCGSIQAALSVFTGSYPGRYWRQAKEDTAERRSRDGLL